MFKFNNYVPALFTTVVIGIITVSTHIMFFVMFVIVNAVPVKITINQSFCSQLSRNWLPDTTSAPHLWSYYLRPPAVKIIILWTCHWCYTAWMIWIIVFGTPTTSSVFIISKKKAGWLNAHAHSDLATARALQVCTCAQNEMWLSSQFILDAHPYMFVGSYIKTKCRFKNNTKPQGLRKVPNHEPPAYQHSLTLANIRKNTDCDQESGSSGTANRLEQLITITTI